MGIAYALRYFNAPHLAESGWVDAFGEKVQSICASGTYTLHAIDGAPDAHGYPVALKIPKPDTNESYFVSLRKASGMDSGIQTTYLGGANIRVHNGYGNSKWSSPEKVDSILSYSSSEFVFKRA